MISDETEFQNRTEQQTFELVTFFLASFNFAVGLIQLFWTRWLLAMTPRFFCVAVVMVIVPGLGEFIELLSSTHVRTVQGVNQLSIATARKLEII